MVNAGNRLILYWKSRVLRMTHVLISFYEAIRLILSTVRKILARPQIYHLKLSLRLMTIEIMIHAALPQMSQWRPCRFRHRRTIKIELGLFLTLQALIKMHFRLKIWLIRVRQELLSNISVYVASLLIVLLLIHGITANT